MLTELRVRDLAVIADVTLPLRSGLNVLTGETGAGKSMLVDALSLLLGERASADLVRPGAQRAVVEAAFDVAGHPRRAAIAALADELGIDLEDDRLVVRREINAQGRNRAWAGGSPTTVAALATLGQLLVDLHGQHETQSLLRQGAQRDMLDAFGDALAERERVAAAFAEAAALGARETELAARRDDVRKRADYLRHVAQEIEKAAPKPGEDEALDVEAKRLAHVEDLTRLSEQLAELLDGEDAGALTALAGALRVLSQLGKIDPSVSAWRELLETAETNVQELARVVREYAAGIDLDPERLDAVERRRDTLFRLTQKYGATLGEVLHTGEDARRELDLLDTADLDLSQIAERRAAADAALRDAAAALSAKRARAAAKLAKAVERLLPGLGLPGATFVADVKPAPRATASGADVVTFLVQLNPGLDARPLAQVASGGELSRLMLALKVVLAGHDAVPTLVFDEVDQGIGAEVATPVAEALREVSHTRQVLVITHLAQIAACAGHHLRVSKRARGGIATADVTVLTADARQEEIARMLGDADDPVVVRHAVELLKRRQEAGVKN